MILIKLKVRSLACCWHSLCHFCSWHSFLEPSWIKEKLTEWKSWFEMDLLCRSYFLSIITILEWQGSCHFKSTRWVPLLLSETINRYIKPRGLVCLGGGFLFFVTLLCDYRWLLHKPTVDPSTFRCIAPNWNRQNVSVGAVFFRPCEALGVSQTSINDKILEQHSMDSNMGTGISRTPDPFWVISFCDLWR